MGRRLCAAGAAIGRRVWERPRRQDPRRRAAGRAYIELAFWGPGRASPGRLALPAPLRTPITSRAPGMAPSTVAVEMLSPKEKNRVSATRPARAIPFPRGLRRPPPT